MLPPARRVESAGVRIRRPLLAVGLAAGCLAAVLGPAPASAATAPLPTRLTHLGDARQVVVVTSSSWSTSYARLRAYGQDADGVWHLRYGPMKARLGYAGFLRAAERRQNTGTTPAGTFRLARAFGSEADPGTTLPYRRFDANDYWVYDPSDAATYNMLEPFRSRRAAWRTVWAEHLSDYGARQYRLAAVIDFNRSHRTYWSTSWDERRTDHPADTARGGGIFLHVRGSGATAGCVSVGYAHMRALLDWLSAARAPRIVMGPAAVITSM
jgi:L,D-peptidoglycan transpeptidase YkuD (ErfK/YbiS/YcfS/YnhG family)